MRHRLQFLRLLLLCLGLLFCIPGTAAEPTTYPAAARERYEQGKALQKQGKLKEALEAFEDAARLGMADYPRLYLAKAAVQQELRSHDAAIAAYTKIIDGFGIEDSCRY
jgi:tetratricopeptide (TPR) repeat protein